MKLHDEGTIIDPHLKEKSFEGKNSYEVRVTYDPKVGGDVWYFYFDTKTFALIGYRFYHNEADNDGEYIVCEDEAIAGGFRIPRKRTWYYHKDGKLLGTDEVTEIATQ